MPNFAFYSGHKQAKRRNFISLFETDRDVSALRVYLFVLVRYV